MGKQVIMEALFDLAVADVNTPMVGVSLGSFTFVINGQSVPFDFDSTCINFSVNQKSTTSTEYSVEYSSAPGFAFTAYDIDAEWAAEEYQKLQLSPEDITAEFLSKATAIEEFFVDPCSSHTDLEITALKVKSIVFSDENGYNWPVEQSVIEEFNHHFACS